MLYTFLVAVTGLWLGSITCLLICVDQNDKGYLGKLRRIFFQSIPIFAQKLSNKILGKKITGFFKGIKHYLIQTNHPLVQIFYLIISVGGFTAYDWYGLLNKQLNVGIGIHFYIANILALFSFYTYYKACSTPPGQNNKQNLKQNLKMYQQFYDNIIYKKQNKCKTCNLIKPARSKHCSLCGYCVLKFDHHCIWVRQCVGRNNYKYFLLFLSQHAVWCLYLAIIAIRMICSFVIRQRLLDTNFNINGVIVKSSISLILQFMLYHYMPIIFLAIMTLLMGSSLVIFVCYHLYLIKSGCTTSQKIKRSDLIDFFSRRQKYLIKQPEQQQKKDQIKNQLQAIRHDRAVIQAFKPKSFRKQLSQVLYT